MNVTSTMEHGVTFTLWNVGMDLEWSIPYKGIMCSQLKVFSQLMLVDVVWRGEKKAAGEFSSSYEVIGYIR